MKKTQFGSFVCMIIEGSVSSGLGRAHVFMAQKHYQNQFMVLLGESAWPGTLNITVKDTNLHRYLALRRLAGIDTLDISEKTRELSKEIRLEGLVPDRIRGFLRDGKSFGGATSFSASIQSKNGTKTDCAVLIPDLTRHVNVAEIISNIYLREEHNLEDGDSVIIELIKSDQI